MAILPSAGILSPSSSKTISPTTTSLLSIAIRSPLRITSTLIAESVSRASRALSVLRPCTNSMPLTKNTSTNIIMPSVNSPKKKYTLAVTSNKINIGSARTCKICCSRFNLRFFSSSFEPCSRRDWATSISLRPLIFDRSLAELFINTIYYIAFWNFTNKL